VSSFTLATTFMKFSLPTVDGGFDALRYAWNQRPDCEGCLKQWILTRKLATRIEDSTQSAWFHSKFSEWSKTLKGWSSEQSACEGMLNKRERDIRRRPRGMPLPSQGRCGCEEKETERGTNATEGKRTKTGISKRREGSRRSSLRRRRRRSSTGSRGRLRRARLFRR
jgi:hypothetical protein